MIETNRVILETIETNMHQKLMNCKKSMEMSDQMSDIEPGTIQDPFCGRCIYATDVSVLPGKFVCGGVSKYAAADDERTV